MQDFSHHRCIFVTVYKHVYVHVCILQLLNVWKTAVITLNNWLIADEMAKQMADAKPSVLVTHSMLHPLIEKVRGLYTSYKVRPVPIYGRNKAATS